MAEELKRLGDTLKSKRKEMNLSLKEVENATSIRSSYLEAIEDGSITALIAGIYAQGFLKQYASFLGMEVEQLVKDNAVAFAMPGEKHEFTYGIGTLEVRGSQGGGVKWFPNLLWAGLSAVVLVVAWYVAKALGVL
jgi:cytoskeletal protein RodZ